MVVAYKGLAKEKEALDASFKILSQKKNENGATLSGPTNEDDNQADGGKEENQFTDPLLVTSTVVDE